MKYIKGFFAAIQAMWSRWRQRKEIWECTYVIHGSCPIFGHGTEQGGFTIRAKDRDEAMAKARKTTEDNAMTSGEGEIKVHRAGMLYVIFGPE